MITVNHRLEQLKIVMIRKTSSWESVGLQEEAAQVDHTSHQWEYGENQGSSLQCAQQGGSE